MVIKKNLYVYIQVTLLWDLIHSWKAASIWNHQRSIKFLYSPFTSLSYTLLSQPNAVVDKLWPVGQIQLQFVFIRFSAYNGFYIFKELKKIRICKRDIHGLQNLNYFYLARYRKSLPIPGLIPGKEKCTYLPWTLGCAT